MFIKFVASELRITNPYKVVLSNDRGKFKTTAYYNPETGELAVMIDPFSPLKITEEAMNLQVDDYYKSWMID